MGVETIIITLIIVLLPVAWLFGRMMDLHWKVKMKRLFFKSNEIIVTFLSKDYRTLKSKSARSDKDVIRFGDKMWVIEQGKIWRSGREEKMIAINDKNLKYEEGVPQIFICDDDIRAVDFNIAKVENIKPEEVASSLISWTENEIARESARKKKSIDMLQVLAIVLIVIIGLFVYNLSGAVQKVSEKIDAKFAAFEANYPSNQQAELGQLDNNSGVNGNKIT